MGFEELVKCQQETGDQIQRIIRNYKKDSDSRKTLNYLQEKLRELQNLWDSFESIDTNIRIDFPTNLDHAYFTKDYYELVSEAFVNIREDIVNKIDTWQAQGAAGSDKTLNSKLIDPAPAPRQIQVQDLEKQGFTKSPSQSTGTKGDSKSVNNPQPDYGTSSKTNSVATAAIRKQLSLMRSLQRILSGLEMTQQRSEQFYQFKIQSIERYWAEIEGLHYKIWELTNDPTLDGYQPDDYFNLEETVESKIIELHEGLSQRNPATHNQQPHNDSFTMKLPKIVLPKFDGDYLKWRQFHDLFTEIVHNNTIPDCQKMWYLKTSLTGEAEKLVRHLTMSDANYATAWKIINERYENTRLLVTALLNKLLSQPSQTNESASTIKALHDTTQECLLGLENLGVSTDQWDSLLLHILIKKLDRNTHTLYEQSLAHPRALQSIKDFLSFLEIRFQSLEALGNKGKQGEEHPRRFRVSQSLTSTTSSTGVCMQCKGNHQLYSCLKFLQQTPAKRLNFVRRSNLCINCLRFGHTTMNCKSRGCTKCLKNTIRCCT